MKTRLFIGNLAESVTEMDLREKFEALFSNKNEAEVGNVEVRSKNESNFFGYVDVHCKNETQDGGKVPLFLRKYIDLMNNTKWKGSLIKVQVAKESFIDKLRREQQSRTGDNNNEVRANHHSFGGNDRHFRSNHDDTNENSSEQSRNQRHAIDILNKMNKRETRNERRNGQNKISASDGEGKRANFGFEIVSKEDTKGPSNEKTSFPPKRKQKNKKGRKAYSSSDDESDDQIRDGIPRFKGLLLSYPEGIPPPANPSPSTTVTEEVIPLIEEDVKEEETRPLIQEKLLSIAFESDRPKRRENRKEMKPSKLVEKPDEQTTTVINFKREKQQKSDQLRLQSLNKLKDLKTQRKNLIKSSLATVTAAAPVTEKRKVFDDGDEQDENEVGSENKKQKMTLFDEEENDEDADDVFQVKKQFEGVQGQKLLEMQTRWGNDDRFKVDDRFKESDEDSEDNEEKQAEKEKEKQLNILTDILGKDFSTAPKEPTKKSKKPATTSNTFSSVILPRYDPEAEETTQQESKTEAKVKSKKSPKKEDPKEIKAAPEEPKPIRSSEPATYKVASNLKEMFSSSIKEGQSNAKEELPQVSTLSDSSKQSSFSLLAAFGKSVDEDEEVTGGKLQAKNKTQDESSGPRSFWQSNPFRYDSSDDEGDDVKNSKKKNEKHVPEQKASVTDMKIHGKVSFFFTKDDKRFEGLDDYFLKLDDYEGKGENGDGTGESRVEDFSEKRKELKAIVKAKIKNTKRKDEKRTLAIKRAIRNRKRKIFQKNKNSNITSTVK